MKDRLEREEERTEEKIGGLILRETIRGLREDRLGMLERIGVLE